MFFESLGRVLADCQWADRWQEAGVEYHFSDTSAAFFENARNRFRKWSDVMQFKTLNIEQDPALQGFDTGSYDLIIATNVSVSMIASNLENYKIRCIRKRSFDQLTLSCRFCMPHKTCNFLYNMQSLYLNRKSPETIFSSSSSIANVIYY